MRRSAKEINFLNIVIRLVDELELDKNAKEALKNGFGGLKKVSNTHTCIELFGDTYLIRWKNSNRWQISVTK